MAWAGGGDVGRPGGVDGDAAAAAVNGAQTPPVLRKRHRAPRQVRRERKVTQPQQGRHRGRS